MPCSRAFSLRHRMLSTSIWGVRAHLDRQMHFKVADLSVRGTDGNLYVAAEKPNVLEESLRREATQAPAEQRRYLGLIDSQVSSCRSLVEPFRGDCPRDLTRELRLQHGLFGILHPQVGKDIPAAHREISLRPLHPCPPRLGSGSATPRRYASFGMRMQVQALPAGGTCNATGVSLRYIQRIEAGG